jgi:uncharacterized DUF497 family protein
VGFEWDERKAESKKHGVNFEKLERCFRIHRLAFSMMTRIRMRSREK